jgi:glycosyltransferase involved in cell wall biosynthesis
MKILHFTTHLSGGGAEMMLCNLVEHLKHTGMEQVVVCLSNKNPDSTATRIQKAANLVHDLNARSFVRLATLRELWRIIRKEKPDVVQTWMHKPDLIGGIVARLAGCRRVVWGIHSMDISTAPGERGWKNWVFRKLLSIASKFVPSKIVSCSEAARRQHESFGYKSNKFAFIPNGVDMARFHPNETARADIRAELGIPVAAPLIAFVGRFAKVKDLPTFIRAAAKFQAIRPNVHFLCCGNAEGDQTPIRAALDELLDRSRFHLRPFRRDVEKICAAADVLSLTSLSEAFPMVLIEAMACGTPCVSTRVGDAEAILSGTGALVSVGDVSGVSQAWGALLEKVGAGLSAEVRCLSVDRFGIRVCTESYASLYRSLIGDASIVQELKPLTATNS